MKTVLGLVGMPASGKSTAIEVAKEYGSIIVMGDVVRDEVKRQGLQISAETIGKVATQLRIDEGPTSIAKRCIEKIKSIPDNNVFIDGLRSMDEVNLFRQHFSMIIIAIIAPDNLRHQWLLARKRSDDGDTLQQIQERDTRELNLGIGAVIENADFIIHNLGSIEELHINCKLTFDNILK